MHGIRTGVIGATVLALGLAWGTPAIAANSGAANSRAANSGVTNSGAAGSGAAKASKPKVLLVGSYHGRSGDYTDIQSAVDAAKPGDWVLVGPGDYHERADYRHDGSATGAGGAVLVTTPGVHLRGMDRNAVVVDGTKPGAPKCSSAPNDQDLGPRDAAAAPVGRNGVFVSKADGVSIENLTACNFLDGRGGGNQIWFNGGDGSGSVGMGSFRGDYLTATTSYFQDGHPKGSYGIFASNAGGPGVIDHSYASNMSDSSYYIGACPDCQTTLIRAHAQGSALGYSGTNSGGRLTIVASEFDHNKTGISTNSQNNDDAPSPQDGACPVGVSTTSAIGSCTFFVLNNIHDNNNPNVPSAGSADLGPVGTGMVLAGGRHDTLAYNRVVNNGAWGLLLVPFPDTSTNPPPVANCAGGVDHPGDLLGALGVTCFFDDFANEIVGNAMGNNGFFGNATNGDLADLSGQHDVGNCWHDNTNPAGVSSSPENLQTTHGTCGVPNAGADILSPLSLQVICDTEAFGPCATTPDQNYPRKTQTTLTPLPSQPTMRNPCLGVPRNRWCGDGDERSDFVRNVLVPGEAGGLAPTTHSTDQIPLYDGLTPKFDQVSNDDLSTYFKDESMGDAGGTPETTPRGNGLRITRDSFGVPHIVGQTRFDTEFGAGWATAEDRGLILERRSVAPLVSRRWTSPAWTRSDSRPACASSRRVNRPKTSSRNKRWERSRRRVPTVSRSSPTSTRTSRGSMRITRRRETRPRPGRATTCSRRRH